MGTLNIDLLGTSFSIEAKEDTQYLEKLLEHYSLALKEVRLMAHNADPLKVAILTGIMISDELYKDRAKAEDVKKLLEASGNSDNISKPDIHELEKITLKMIQDIDKVLP